MTAIPGALDHLEKQLTSWEGQLEKLDQKLMEVYLSFDGRDAVYNFAIHYATVLADSPPEDRPRRSAALPALLQLEFDRQMARQLRALLSDRDGLAAKCAALTLVIGALPRLDILHLWSGLHASTQRSMLGSAQSSAA